MNLDFSDDQKFLQEEARKFFDKEGGLSNARKVMDNSLEADENLWQKIVEIFVPEYSKFSDLFEPENDISLSYVSTFNSSNSLHKFG